MEDEGFGYELGGDELRQTIAASRDDRLKYFVDKCHQCGQVWTLGAEEDLVVLADESDEPFVLAFPHPEFAQDWIETTDLEEVELVALGTADWEKEVLPGLQEAEIKILVLPTSEGEGAMLEAGKLAEVMTSTASA